MSRLQRLRDRALTLRGALSLGGAVVVTASMSQVAGTLAAPAVVRTAKMPVASGNYYPTPLTTSVTCTTTYTGWITGRRAEISWAAVPGATGYRMELIRKDNGSVWSTKDVDAPSTSVGDISDSDRHGLYARVRTKNGSVVSSGFTVSNTGMSFKDWVSGRTECEGGSGTSLPNQPWENSSTWTPGTTTFARQPMALGGMLNEVPLEESAETLPPEGTLTALEEELATAQETSAQSTTATSQFTEPSSSTPSDTTPATTAAGDDPTASTTVPTEVPAGTTESSTAGSSTTAPTTVVSTRTTAASTTPRSTTTVSANAATSTATTTQAAPTTSSTVPVAAGPVALPGGGEAEIVGGTRLVVSDGSAPVCTATVREGSTLKMRGGVLELTDAGGTHTVNQETCELT